jgi:hypothetical protein
MSMPPKDEFRACMRVLYIAILDARSAGWQSDVNPARLADLMDAIHNIPNLVQNWEGCNQDLMKSMLLDYERKWRSEGPCLKTIYEQALANES